jgi:hypothetical protein
MLPEDVTWVCVFCIHQPKTADHARLRGGKRHGWMRRTILGIAVVLLLALSGAVTAFAEVSASAIHHAPALLLRAGIPAILVVVGLLAGPRLSGRK